MAKEKIGEVSTPGGGKFDVFWDKDTGEVYVGDNRVGNASSREQALNEANHNPTETRGGPGVTDR